MSYSIQNGSFKSFVFNFVNWFLYRVTCSVLLQENSETSRNDQNWTFFKLDKPCYLPHFWLDKGFKRSVVLFLRMVTWNIHDNLCFSFLLALFWTFTMIKLYICLNYLNLFLFFKISILENAEVSRNLFQVFIFFQSSLRTRNTHLLLLST